LKISERARYTAPSPTLAITAKAKALQAQGKDVVGFGAGEPDFDTPDHIKNAAKAALDSGYTKYTPSAGDNDLKEAILAKLQNENGLTYKPNQIIVSCGAKHSLYNIMQAMLDPGDEVIIPAPYWVSYPEQVKLAGATPVIVETLPQNAFMPTKEAVSAAITPNTKALVLNSPSNPTGGVATTQIIEDMVALAIEHGFQIISDEIYEHLLYDGRTHTSPASLSPEAYNHVITVNGCSKAYSMTGWRIGYIAAHSAELISAMGRIQDQSTSNPTSIAQKAAVAALTGTQEPVEMMRKAFEVRRNLFVDGLNAIPGVHCEMPGGAFYAFPNIASFKGKAYGDKKIQTSDDIAAYLLEEALVAVVPGSGFGADDYMRLSYATSNAKIEKGLERIATALAKLV
jgi:aspartate aminotransferase